jgi:hypothetical protein
MSESENLPMDNQNPLLPLPEDTNNLEHKTHQLSLPIL